MQSLCESKKVIYMCPNALPSYIHQTNSKYYNQYHCLILPQLVPILINVLIWVSVHQALIDYLPRHHLAFLYVDSRFDCLLG